MPTFEGFGAWIKIGRQRQEEFQIQTNIIENTTSTVCYIASETDKEFSIHWQAPINAPDICINVFVDGKFIDDSLSGAADDGYRTGAFRGVQAEGNSIALFSFSAPSKSTIGVENGRTGFEAEMPESISDAPEDPIPLSSCIQAREAGTIHIEMFEVEISDEDVSDSGSDLEDIWKRCTDLRSNPLPEDKKLILTHTTGSQRTITLAQKPEKWVYTILPDKHIMSFTFQYRGRNFLEAAGILPRPARGCRFSARLRKTDQGDGLNRELNDEGQVQNLNSNGSRGDAELFNVKKEKTPFPARVLGPTAEEREEELSIAREREELAKRKRELEVKERCLEERQKRLKTGYLEDRKPGWHRVNAPQDLKVLDDGSIDLTDD